MGTASSKDNLSRSNKNQTPLTQQPDDNQLSQRTSVLSQNPQLTFIGDADPGAIYERMILIIPYRAADQVRKIEQSFEAININLLDLLNSRYLNTKELSEDDKQNRNLDFLGGFELMDKEMRMYIIEGLGGLGRSMNQFYEANQRDHTNDRRFKMIYNPEIRF